MGLSETILAAIIGAGATMLTAMFQLLRNRAPAESRPKKNRVRSTFALFALVLGAVVGGYFWSELRAVSAREEIAALRADLKLAVRTQADAEPADANATATPMATSHGIAGSAESVAHLPPCQVTKLAEDAGPTACNDTLATKIALCALVPSASQTTAVHVEARVPLSDSPWMPADGGATVLGNLHLAAQSSEYPASPDKRSVCMDVANWSVEDTLAVRVIVDYAFPSSPAGELTAAAPVAQL